MNEIAILSGKGGTGKSCLCAAFATIQNDIVVADCDVDAANMYLILQPVNYMETRFLTGYKAVVEYSGCIDCGLCADLCRFDAIIRSQGLITISEIYCDGCMLCSRACPTKSIKMIPSDKSIWYAGNYRNGKIIHARLSPGEENSGKLVNVVRDYARKTAVETGWENIIIDGPPGTGCPAISSINGVDRVIVVTEPSNSGFHDMKRVLELIGNFGIKPYVVINKYDLNNSVTCKIESWCKERQVCMAGKIPFDPDVVEAMLNCKSIIEWRPGSEAAKAIKAIWHLINSIEENNN